jgi:hypothetical protein
MTTPKRRWWIPAKTNPNATRRGVLVGVFVGAIGSGIFGTVWSYSKGWQLPWMIPFLFICGAFFGGLLVWQLED